MAAEKKCMSITNDKGQTALLFLGKVEAKIKVADLHPWLLVLGARHTLQLFNVCNIWSTISCNPNRSARGTRCNFEPVPSQSHSK